MTFSNALSIALRTSSEGMETGLIAIFYLFIEIFANDEMTKFQRLDSKTEKELLSIIPLTQDSTAPLPIFAEKRRSISQYDPNVG